MLPFSTYSRARPKIENYICCAQSKCKIIETFMFVFPFFRFSRPSTNFLIPFLLFSVSPSSVATRGASGGRGRRGREKKNFFRNHFLPFLPRVKLNVERGRFTSKSNDGFVEQAAAVANGSHGPDSSVLRQPLSHGGASLSVRVAGIEITVSLFPLSTCCITSPTQTNPPTAPVR
jgi:hypothetical protein